MKEHGVFIFLILIIILMILVAGAVFDEAPKYNNRPDNNRVDNRDTSYTPTDNKENNKEEIKVVDYGVKISGYSRGFGDRPARITLRTSLEENETVDITGWKIEGNDGSIVIPQAVPIYEIYGPNKSENINLGYRDFVYIYIGKESPVGKNFRLNKCTGYLNDTAEFQYRIEANCPEPTRDEYKHLSGECQEYIRTLRNCKLPDINTTNSFKGDEGNLCREFIDNFFGIKNCYESQKNNSDFLSNELRVWIDRDYVFFFFFDWLRLTNEDGDVVSEYTY